MDEALPQATATSSNDDHTPNNAAHVDNRYLATYNAPSPWSPLSRILDNVVRLADETSSIQAV